jgi:hypothetical protein
MPCKPLRSATNTYGRAGGKNGVVGKLGHKTLMNCGLAGQVCGAGNPTLKTAYLLIIVACCNCCFMI